MTRGTAMIALLTAVLAVFSIMAVPGTAQASAVREPVRLTLDRFTPEVPREPTTEITVAGTLSNPGDAAVPSARVRVRFSSQPLRSRAEMAAYLAGTPGYDPRYRSVQQAPDLAAGGKARFEFTLTPAELDITAFGVYPLTVELVDMAERQLAVQRTFLTYAPKGQRLPRTTLAVALPLLDRPHRTEDTIFADDSLRQALTPEGRLGRLLELAEAGHRGVTWFVDPALLDDVQQLTRSHAVRTADPARSGAVTARRPADPAAAAWLTGLRTALAEVPVLALPYADPDVAALVHHGLDELTGQAIDRSKALVAPLLGKDAPVTAYWPAGGTIDADGLDELASAGVTRLLLSGSALPADPPVSFTPHAAATVQSVFGPVEVLLADPVLGQLLSTEASAAATAVPARQRFLAETAMIAMELPEVARTVVAAPGRRWDPDPELVGALLTSVAKAPWIRLTGLDQVRAKRPKKHPAVTRSGPVYTDQHREAELGRAYLAQVRDLHRQVRLTAQVTGTEAFDAAVLRLTSTAWRGETAAAGRRVAQVAAAVRDRMNEISIAGEDQPRNLAGENGVVPISIQNRLDTPVSVRLEVTPDDPSKIQVGDYDRDRTIEIGGRQTQLVSVPMTMRGGESTVTVQLLTADGRPYGDPVRLTVHTAGYTGIALFIVGGALAVMLAAVIMRILRRRVRKPAGTAA